MQDDIFIEGRENIRTAGLQRLIDGSLWVQCPYCGKRSFPVNRNTEVIELYIRCRGSNCKKIYRIDIQRPTAARTSQRREGARNG